MAYRPGLKAGEQTSTKEQLSKPAPPGGLSVCSA